MEADWAIEADYRTHKHIPSRKCYQLILEVPEEEFPGVCKVLGYPVTGENTYVGLALLDKAVIQENRTIEKTEGEKLRIRAIMLCKDAEFQRYVADIYYFPKTEEDAASYIRITCSVSSRSEIAMNPTAQEKFRDVLKKFTTWRLAQQSTDNLSRI